MLWMGAAVASLLHPFRERERQRETEQLVVKRRQTSSKTRVIGHRCHLRTDTQIRESERTRTKEGERDGVI